MRQADELDDMRDIFGADFAMLAGLYLSDTPKRLAELQAAAAAGDATLAAKVVHTLGGSCASIGASGLAAICQALEMRCRSGTLGNFGAYLLEIEAEYARIEARLRAML